MFECENYVNHMLLHSQSIDLDTFEHLWEIMDQSGRPIEAISLGRIVISLVQFQRLLEFMMRFIDTALVACGSPTP